MKATKNFIIRKMESEDVPQAHEIEKNALLTHGHQIYYTKN